MAWWFTLELLLNISWKKTPWKLNPFLGWRQLWFNIRNIWLWNSCKLMVIKLCGARVDLCGGVIGVGNLHYWPEFFKEILGFNSLSSYYLFQIVPMLLLLLEASVYTSNSLFCKQPKLEKLIYITFVHVSLISLKLKISPSIIITEGGKIIQCVNYLDK